MIANPHAATGPHIPSRKWQPILVAILLATACSAPAASAQQPASKPSPKPAPKAMNQGLQISGYWKIDVRNPDGTLDKHVEFENSVTSEALILTLPTALFGQQAYFAAGTALNNAFPGGVFATGSDAPFIGVNGGPAINNGDAGSVYPVFPWYGDGMNGTSGYYGSPCSEISGCLITKSNSAAYYSCLYYSFGADNPNSAPGCFDGLSVQYAAQGGGANVLSGSFVATRAGNIYDVWSYVTLCLPQIPVAGSVVCPLPAGTTLPVAGANPPPIAAMGLDLTSYTLPTPLAVASGQSVNISVSLTFSSPPASNSNARSVPMVPAASRLPTGPGKP